MNSMAIGIMRSYPAKFVQFILLQVLIYLPPYSPDLNPIEQMWGKVKNCLRKESARTLDKFAISINAAFMSIQSTDLANWYGHCGYRTL